MRLRGARARFVFVGLPLLAFGCGSGPEPTAFKNRIFYQYGDLAQSGNNKDVKEYEEHYPPLDRTEQTPSPEYVGVSVLGGTVHISRPKNWTIRQASNKAEERYIEYTSPNEYLFAIYERADSPEDTWRDIMQRYEDDAKANGAEILGSHIPYATWNAQGRAYVVKRRVKAAKGPFVNMSREILARSDHRVVLIQIVHQGKDLATLSDDLLRVVQTLEIL